jgi:outer membrane scaffolding protein for murein synthesis (MipA/OmpV family)
VRSLFAAATCAMILAAAPPAAARDEPLWEAGLGIAGITFPAYRGSDQTRGYVLPAPYLTYRGDLLKSDRHGVRGVFFKREDVDLHLSVGASLPVDSSDTPVREGMPDLKPSVEIGPSLEVTLWRSQDNHTKLDLRLPLRFAFTLESTPRYIGAQLFPNLNVDVRAPFGFTGWNLGMFAGPVLTNSRYNRYFYEVPQEFATATRPAYGGPGGGYGGMQFLVALSKRFPGYWVGGFARYDTLQGAVFGDSPLVTSKHYAAAGIGISWILGRSSTRVQVDEFDEARR